MPKREVTQSGCREPKPSRKQGKQEGRRLSGVKRRKEEKEDWMGSEPGEDRAQGASVKQESAQGGCLGTSRRRRTWQAAKSLGELQASVDPGVSEWGNPAEVILRHLPREEPTQGTETSKYLEEKKSTEIP